MRLFEGAVYLIIAGALLGPINGQYKPLGDNLIDGKKELGSELGAWRGEVILCWQKLHAVLPDRVNDDIMDVCQSRINKKWVFGGKLVTETTAETCARAMKDIGVDVPPAEIERLAGKELASMKALLFGRRVLCIPAPSGMK